MKALARTFPGQRIYVPWSNVDAMHRFRENFEPLIGVAAVFALFELFGGLRIAVPTHRIPERYKGFVPVDLAAVVALTAEHKSAYEISKELGCDPRSVHKARTKARQLGLITTRKRKGARS